MNIDFVERQSQIEGLSEEILEAKHQVMAYDKRRNVNREALNAFRSRKVKPGKVWFNVDDLFIKMPQVDGKRLIEKDQTVLTDEMAVLRTNMKNKTMELQKLEGSEVSSLGLEPMTKNDTAAPETKPQRKR
ncbi:hypothetical protein SARC_06612 [Sphaeroforma arctica JP610]|uniref:Uncharacterized protein n=1 Tax=Sphaeroforma arctica JP610 TaxID=667725 RepID=A0A0L0FW45_9EUKA|nr:hypothetical protein SARC_06612 [Sphaeroforma arctica JP610]KNC81052.1 hypothetical protein SARC_06612 [Sphaeroforma arctica JP610]|eukprot:XP_014154954.1 hypothetical protein SARC_06612 [Sphaeroforma arctica JP610]